MEDVIVEHRTVPGLENFRRARIVAICVVEKSVEIVVMMLQKMTLRP